MRVEMWKIEKVIPYKNNPRENKKSIRVVANSISEFGFQQPIVVDSEGVIVAGHTRYHASQLLRLELVPVVVADKLTREQVTAYRLADNRTSEDSAWVDDKLADELASLAEVNYDLSITGFTDKELDKLLNPQEVVEGEVPFTEELMEKHNYIVLYFDNEIDWLQAQTLFGIQTVAGLDSRDGYEKKGVGRVLRGGEALGKLVSSEN